MSIAERASSKSRSEISLDNFLEAIRTKPRRSASENETQALVSRIENASLALSEYYERSHQFEKALRDATDREARLVQRLDEASIRISGLQQEVLSERNRAARAEATSRSTASILETRDQELKQLRGDFDMLTKAIERSFEHASGA